MTIANVPQSGLFPRVIATCAVIRPLTCLLAASSAGCGGYLVSGLAVLASSRGWLAMVCMASLLGIANTVNDIVDLPADRDGKPQRPIPSGRIGVTTAWGVVAVLTALTTATALALGPAETAFAGALVLLAFAYSYRLKNTVLLGNFVVASVCSSTLLFGSLASATITSPSSVAAGVVLTFVVGYEIVKTLQDRVTDRAAGLRTLATEHGAEASVAAFAGAAAITAAIALGLGLCISSRPWVYLALVVPALIGPLCWCTYTLRSCPDVSRASARSLLVMRLAWFPGLLSLTFLK
ncbi:UbiA family prenyltransferase [Amycolatopsis sp. NPDC003865]